MARGKRHTLDGASKLVGYIDRHDARVCNVRRGRHGGLERLHFDGVERSCTLRPR